MNSPKHETKVGAFVLGGGVLLVALLLLFSKGFTLAPTYTLKLHAGSAGILKRKSTVQMAGVPVGAIENIELTTEGRSVTVFLKLEKKYKVYRDARFAIEQSGFLGDQYVAILPGENKGAVLVDGDEVNAETPFDLQEVARSAAGFIKRIDDTAKRLNETIDDIRAKALNDQTLTNLANSVAALNKFSEDALGTVDNLNQLIRTNTPQISATLANLHTASVALTNIMADVQAGKGPVGRALHDEKLANDLALIAANLSITTSNMNKLGVWNVLWKTHPTATEAPIKTK
jgi:phospholipid/cholesterol/gamma-HCH transport system substrate-binding protein